MDSRRGNFQGQQSRNSPVFPPGSPSTASAVDVGASSVVVRCECAPTKTTCKPCTQNNEDQRPCPSLFPAQVPGLDASHGESGPEHAAAVARQAFDLLQSWRLVPGTSGATIDPAALKSWIREARTLSAKTGRSRVADRAIGQVLGKASNDADEFWPPRAIRDAIESTRSRELEQDIANGVFSNRGLTVRSPNDGGQQERDLAAFYRASSQVVASKWLRTSALLERIAKDYEHMAERHDQIAERLEWER